MKLAHAFPPEWQGGARWAQTFLSTLPLVLVAGLIAGKLVNHWQYWHIFIEEDGPIEWFTALLYLAASPVAAVLARRFFKAGLTLHGVLACILAVGMLFIGMEEISWGQRIFAIPTPEALAEINRQQELNLHNIGEGSLALSLTFIVVSGYAATAFLWVPGLLRNVFGGRYASIGKLISPPRFLAGFFLPVLLLFSYYIACDHLGWLHGGAWSYGGFPDEGHFILGRDQEPVEWIMAIGFLLFACWLLLLQKAGGWEEGGPAQPA